MKYRKYYEEFSLKEPNERKSFIIGIAESEAVSYSTVKKALYALHKKNRIKTQSKTTSDLVKEDRTVFRLKTNENILSSKYKHLLKEYEELEKRFDTLLNIKEDVEIPVINIRNADHRKNEATPIVMLSDWHFEERVDPRTINGLNEYNLEIAEKRWFKCIQNSLRLISIDRNHSEINSLVLWLGGDMITGYIHEELIESNYLSPTEATRFAKKQIIAAIEFYIQHGKFTNIHVVCNYGNHGRTTLKPKYSTGYKNSYEYMMYRDICDYFKNQESVTFTIPEGAFAYVKIYDFVCRFWHGDTIKYQGGIGGLTVPLIKAIHRYNQQMQADYNFLGHYHQLFQATKDCTVNGSGIGFNAYAQRIGASYEPPQQGYTLIDSVKGMTIKAPIFCV